mmetsp:Transcript_3062/g.11132  ORF Transcript_3062/g.11132 Transcript_3062/m.11132 type:complete len:204 (-) Transcript_3062:585-1196(-)
MAWISAMSMRRGGPCAWSAASARSQMLPRESCWKGFGERRPALCRNSSMSLLATEAVSGVEERARRRCPFRSASACSRRAFIARRTSRNSWRHCTTGETPEARPQLDGVPLRLPERDPERASAFPALFPAPLPPPLFPAPPLPLPPPEACAGGMRNPPAPAFAGGLRGGGPTAAGPAKCSSGRSAASFRARAFSPPWCPPACE